MGSAHWFRNVYAYCVAESHPACARADPRHVTTTRDTATRRDRLMRHSSIPYDLATVQFVTSLPMRYGGPAEPPARRRLPHRTRWIRRSFDISPPFSNGWLPRAIQ